MKAKDNDRFDSTDTQRPSSLFGKQIDVVKRDSPFMVLKPNYHQESDSVSCIWLGSPPTFSCLPLKAAHQGCHPATFWLSVGEVFSVRAAVPGALSPLSCRKSVYFASMLQTFIPYPLVGEVPVCLFFILLIPFIQNDWYLTVKILCLSRNISFASGIPFTYKFISGSCIRILDCQAQFLWNSPVKIFLSKTNCSEVHSRAFIGCT